ncbi:MAG TPA: NUDIX domain-containing protein [Jatrophihabitans sp.]|nr:NUDIX domain-containing protein [Jatrophihabitans sp.]
MTARTTPVLAAGGVVWRQDRLDLLVALVHRPRYDDWTLPKGKVRDGEQLVVAAIREVAEETGAVVEVGRRLAPVEYPIGNVHKRVSHWSMRYVAGEHEPGDEVDEIRWLTVAEAAQRLTYPVDRAVLADFARIPADTTTVVLLRHAKAGKRTQWQGDDRLRPLDKIGRRHAREIVPVLAGFVPRRVLAADRLRCEQSVIPVATTLSLTVQSAPEFSDEAQAADPGGTLSAFWRVAGQPGTTVICSQGSAIPNLLADLEVPSSSLDGDYPSRKGSIWVLSVIENRIVAGDYYPHPNA